MSDFIYCCIILLSLATCNKVINQTGELATHESNDRVIYTDKLWASIKDYFTFSDDPLNS